MFWYSTVSWSGSPDRRIALASIYVIAANEFAWGASEALWTHAAPHLLECGVNLTANVKGWQPEHPVVGRLEELGCHVIRRPDTRAERERPIHELPYAERADQSLKHVRPDLVLVNQGDNIEGLGWMEACLELGLPYLVVSHSASDQRWPDDELATRLRRGYLGALHVSFVSEHNRAMTERQALGPIPGADMVASTFNVRIDNDVAWTDSDPVRIAMVGRLDPDSKGQDVLFELLATPAWRTRRPLVDVYGEGHCGQVLHSLRDRLGLDTVRFRGFTTDIESIWRDHQLLLLPSRVEGMPTVVIEAMLCGRVVVAADVGGVREIVTDGLDGFVAAAATVGGMGEALERAWQRRDQWPAIGARARASMGRRAVPDADKRFAARLLELIT